MKLIRESTGEPINVGDVAHSFSGDAAIITGWQEPQHAGSTGRVYVQEMNERRFHREYFPSVYGLKWV